MVIVAFLSVPRTVFMVLVAHPMSVSVSQVTEAHCVTIVSSKIIHIIYTFLAIIVIIKLKIKENIFALSSILMTDLVFTIYFYYYYIILFNFYYIYYFINL